MTLRKLLPILFLGWLLLAPVPEKALQSNSKNLIDVETALRARGGSISTLNKISSKVSTQSNNLMSIPNKNSSVATQSNNLAKKKAFREMLKEHFPDSNERINYQKEQAKFYRSAQSKIFEAKRTGRAYPEKILSSRERDAIDYFQGTGFYEKYQAPGVKPNIYDTRKSFLLKMENDDEMREEFLKDYNLLRIQLSTETKP
jgi:hypothetical protein